MADSQPKPHSLGLAQCPITHRCQSFIPRSRQRHPPHRRHSSMHAAQETQRRHVTLGRALHASLSRQLAHPHNTERWRGTCAPVCADTETTNSLAPNQSTHHRHPPSVRCTPIRYLSSRSPSDPRPCHAQSLLCLRGRSCQRHHCCHQPGSCRHGPHLPHAQRIQPAGLDGAASTSGFQILSADHSFP